MQNRIGLLALVLGRMRSIQYWAVPVAGNVAGANADAKKVATGFSVSFFIGG
jgi:hypothetical protein